MQVISVFVVVLCLIGGVSCRFWKVSLNSSAGLKAKQHQPNNYSLNAAKHFPTEPHQLAKLEGTKDGDAIITTSLYATFGPCGQWDPDEPASSAMLKYFNLTASLAGSRGGSKGTCYYKMHGMINGQTSCVEQKFCFLAKFGVFIAGRGIRHLTMSHSPGPNFGHLANTLTSVYLESSRSGQSTNCSSFACEETENMLEELNQLFQSQSWKSLSPRLTARNKNSRKENNIQRNDDSPNFWTRLRGKIAYLVEQVVKNFTVCSFGVMCDLGNRVRLSAAHNQQYHKFQQELIQILDSIPEHQRWSGFEVLRIATRHGFDCSMFSCPLFNRSSPAINPRLRQPLA